MFSWDNAASLKTHNSRTCCCSLHLSSNVRSCTGNQLHSTIPTELGLLSKLQVLYLSRNQLTGTIPTYLGKLRQLNYLGLQHNLLTGTIPTELGYLSKLRYLGLEKNDLRDSIHIHHIQYVSTYVQGLHPDFLFFSDCRGIITGSNETSKSAEVHCDCCTECYRY
jgi:hypothetical protein